MFLLVLIFIFIITLLNLLLFGGNLLTSIILVILAAALLVVRIFLDKKLNGKLKKLIYIVGLVAAFILAIISSVGKADKGVVAYADAMTDALNSYKTQDYDTVYTKVDKIIEEYGVTDDALYLKSDAYLAQFLPEKAQEAINGIQDKKSEKYYISQSKVYNQTGDEKRMLELTKEGANINPNSFTLQLLAGCMAAQSYEYMSAEYYLGRAYTLNPNSKEASYALAGVYYINGDMTKAKEFMDVAYSLGMDENSSYRNDILMKWYISEKEGDKS